MNFVTYFLLICFLTCVATDDDHWIDEYRDEYLASRTGYILPRLTSHVLENRRRIQYDEEVVSDNSSYTGFRNFFKDCISPPPVCPNINISYWLFTRQNENDPYLLDMLNIDSIQRAPFRPNQPLKILIHGYTGYRDFDPNPQIRPEYLRKGDMNIISLDYGPLVRPPCYIQAAYNLALVGNCTAQMIDTLISLGKFKLEDIHVVGFSLGGQVGGQIANYIRSGKLERITGLDPAMPLFTTINIDSKLDASDAKFVDVIHTNAGWKGKLEPCGHVDFYPNGGYEQVGCKATETDDASSCHHLRAPEYFGESINSETGFWGIPCSNYIYYLLGLCDTDENNLMIMGEYTPRTASGIYYLQTRSERPFALGKLTKIVSQNTKRSFPTK